jgi:hypothetical protein
MKQLLQFAGAMLLLASVSSCYPSLYYADRAQTTAFTDKNQFVANASLKPQITPNDSLNLTSSAASYSVDAAYSFDKNWAITGAYSNTHNRRVREDQAGLSYGNRLGGVHNGKRYELGVTYFKPNEKKTGITELSLGISTGNVDRISVLTPQYNFKTRYNSLFGQAAYSIRNDYVVFSVGAKLWAQNYYSFDGPASVRRKYSSPQNGIDIERYPFFFTNLFYNFEAGYKFIKFNMQMGMPFQLNGRSISGFPFYATFGLVFRLEKDIFKNKQYNNDDEKLQ